MKLMIRRRFTRLMKIDDGICPSKLDHLNMMVTETLA